MNPHGRSLRIALLNSDFPPVKVAGVAQWGYGLTQGLVGLGHRVTVYTKASSIRRSTMHDGAPYRVVAMGDLEWRRFRSTYAAYHAARIAFSGRFDLFIASHWALATMAVFLSRWYPLKTVVVALGSEVLRDMNPFELRRFRFTVEKATLAASISRFTRNCLVERLGVPEGDVAFIPCGVNAVRFEGNPDVSDLRAKYGLGSGPVILTVARIAGKKGHDVVIRALPKLLSRHPGLKYLIAGRGAPSYIERLKAIARECGVADRVVFTGFVPTPDIPRLYHLCDVFIMLTREQDRKFEGFGISYLEASACGKPAIGGRSGGIPDAIDDGRSGFLVDPSSSEAAAEKLDLLLSDPEMRRRMGEYGRTRVRTELTWRRVAERLVEAIP
jgi:phosphatidylinositol alpha-1,6-mannosyltransferase